MSRPSRKMPTAAKIAYYWAYREVRDRELAPWSSWGWDHCEPSCMACGIPVMNIDPEVPSFNTWNKAQGFLERCHVISRDMDGLDLEPNLVLMCKPCHAAQPQTRNAEDTWAFMRERTPLDRLIGSGYLSFRNGEIVSTSHGVRGVHETAKANGHACCCPKCDPRWTSA